MEQVQEEVEGESAVIGQRPGPNGLEPEVRGRPFPLSNDETERLIAMCEAPALLWHFEPVSARAPEPFGMIA
jgi:hypothetical protein